MGDAVRRLQRALRRTPDLGINVDGVFGPQLEAAVKSFQEGAGLVADGIVGPQTWNALPDGGPMPALRPKFLLLRDSDDSGVDEGKDQITR